MIPKPLLQSPLIIGSRSSLPSRYKCCNLSIHSIHQTRLIDNSPPRRVNYSHQYLPSKTAGFDKMMNVATPASAHLPSHFAPPARMPSTRRQMYHHPTLHLRSGSSSNGPRFSAGDFVPSASPNTNPNYSPPAIQQMFQRSTSSQSTYSATPGYIVPPLQRQQQGYSPQQQTLQPRASLQRQTTTGSGKSQNQYYQPGPLVLAGHRRQTASTSTSNSSINRVPSGHSHYPVSTPPIPIRSTSGSMSPADSYVARLRRAKATVWSARGQQEDLNRSNSKEERYKNKVTKNRSASSKVISPPPRKVLPRLLTVFCIDQVDSGSVHA
jgi:hypothetical protein